MPYSLLANNLFYNSRIEIISNDRYSSFAPNSVVNTFSLCKYLRRIECTVFFGPNLNGSNCFSGCTSLEFVNFGYMRCNLNLLWSPALTLEMMTKLVRVSDSGVTITVHPDVYSKLIDEENTEWHAILEQAANRNINFVTV